MGADATTAAHFAAVALAAMLADATSTAFLAAVALAAMLADGAPAAFLAAATLPAMRADAGPTAVPAAVPYAAMLADANPAALLALASLAAMLAYAAPAALLALAAPAAMIADAGPTALLALPAPAAMWASRLARPYPSRARTRRLARWQRAAGGRACLRPTTLHTRNRRRVSGSMAPMHWRRHVMCHHTRLLHIGGGIKPYRRHALWRPIFACPTPQQGGRVGGADGPFGGCRHCHWHRGRCPRRGRRQRGRHHETRDVPLHTLVCVCVCVRARRCVRRLCLAAPVLGAQLASWRALGSTKLHCKNHTFAGSVHGYRQARSQPRLLSVSSALSIAARHVPMARRCAGVVRLCAGRRPTA